MFDKLRNNLANIAIPPILDPSVKHNCIITTFNLFIVMLSDTTFLPEVSDYGILFLTIWQLNQFLSHFALQPSSGSHPYSSTCTQAQIPGAWFKILLSCFFVICYLYLSKKNYTFFLIIILFLFMLYVLNVCLHNYWHFSVMVFLSLSGVIY